MRAILVDDEQLALDFLEQKINTFNSIEVVGKYIAVDVDQLESILEDIDIAFLDVEMPIIDGLELAELILSVDPSIHIVFVTAFSEYAVKAFELNSIDYIIKPIEVERLKLTIDRIINLNQLRKTDSLAPEEVLHVQLCNEFSIIGKDGEKEYIKWRTSKAKEVFLYLLHHRGETVRKSALVDLVWEEFDTDKAFPQLYTTVYHIRNTLKLFEHHFSIQNVMDGYTLQTNNVHIDIDEWKNEIDSLPPITESTIGTYESVMDLYQGRYLGNENYLWVASEQYRLETLWTETAHKIAQFYLNQAKLDEAERWYRYISEEFPEDEHAQFSLMKIYYDYNYHLLVEQQYRHLVNVLKEFNTEVSSEIKAWYEKVMN